MASSAEDIRVIIATDCGSTTSKARLFKKIGDQYRYISSGEAPTTVEKPYEDVTVGIRNAIREVEELTGLRLLSNDGVIYPFDGRNTGADLYVTTSSAGGGLQMAVSGVIKQITAESAERAALGAGAIVLEAFAIDDNIPIHNKIEIIRHLRPDMFLIAGGADGGDITHVAQAAELIVASKPMARFDVNYRLPIVFAGNKDMQQYVSKVLSGNYSLKIVDNIRPILEVEVLEPARNAIHEVFMEHVMSHAPGYLKLMKWTTVPIMPTPAGEGMMFQTMANAYHANVIGVGLGGATTNIYSVYDGKFVRTVSANLGMSYSICNVLKEAGIDNIMRWIPFKMEEEAARDRLFNKMIRPTTIPDNIDDLVIEHAVAREALRLGFKHHMSLAAPLRGIGRKGGSDASMWGRDEQLGKTYIDMLKVEWLGGTGGLLSHAPQRMQTALILIDGFEPEGVTKLFQDSVFMMPHLGVLSTVNSKAAMDVFQHDCLVRLGTCIAPKCEETKNREVLTYSMKLPGGSTLSESLTFGQLKAIPLREGETAEVRIAPNRGVDVGGGPGHSIEKNVEGGVCGIIIDCRGRPLVRPEYKNESKEKLIKWFEDLNVYPDAAIEQWRTRNGAL